MPSDLKIEPPSVTRFCFAPQVAHPINPKEMFLASRGGRYQELVPSPLFALLTKCTTPKTLCAHAHETWKALTTRERLGMMKAVTAYHSRLFGELMVGPGSFPKMFERILGHAAERGWFEPISIRRTQRPTTPSIAMVGMVTRNRVASATACLESYIANCKRWGRPASFFVFDDSPEPEVRNHYRQLLKALRQQHDVPLSYAGLEEKTAFARRLTDRGVPPEVIRFALLDAFGLSETYGANRNSFLLDAMGQLAFSIDDDTRCRVARSPGHRTGATFGSMARAIRFEAFPDHHAAAQAVSMEPCDVLTLHEAVLGKFLQECVPDDLEQLELDGVDSRLLALLHDGVGKVVISLNGLFGDSGSNVTIEHLFMGGAQRKQLLRSRRYYQLFTSSRMGVKSVDRLTIDRVDTLMTTFIGLDHREFLPPFFPVFRMEDTLFGEMLSACHPDAYLAFLPWVLEHAPPEHRVSNMRDFARSSSAQFWPGQIVQMAVRQFRLPPGALDPAASYALLGAHLTAIGRMPFEAFRAWYIQQRCLLLSGEIEKLARILHQYPRSPRYWIKDVNTALASRKALLGRPLFLAPDEMISRFGPDKAERQCQQLVLRYGELLCWWPEIRRITQELQLHVAQPV